MAFMVMRVIRQISELDLALSELDLALSELDSNVFGSPLMYYNHLFGPVLTFPHLLVSKYASPTV